MGQRCNHPLRYVKFKANALVNLGIFVDEKYLDDVDSDLTHAGFYSDFYEQHADAFTEEIHFSTLFKVMTLRAYDSEMRQAYGFSTGDQLEFSKTLADRGYSEAFLLFIPLTPSDLFVEDRLQKAILNDALRLEEKSKGGRTVVAAISHTAYHYFASGYLCELQKFDSTFDVLQRSENLDGYIDLLFSQMPEQCGTREWRSSYQLNKQVYCYLQKNPDWVEKYTSGGKLREDLFSDVVCADVR